MAVPLWFGLRAKLYHYAIIGALVMLVILFLPISFILLIILSGGAAWLFYHLIHKEDTLRKEAAEHKRKVEEELKREREQPGAGGDTPTRFSADEIWSPSLIETLNSEEVEDDG
jgi:membrane protein implicated in regulation of membrane protease activity